MYLGNFPSSFPTLLPAGRHRAGSGQGSLEEWSEKCKNGKALQGRHIPISGHPDHEIRRKLFFGIFFIFTTGHFQIPRIQSHDKDNLLGISWSHNKYYESSYMHFHCFSLPAGFTQRTFPPCLFFKPSCHDENSMSWELFAARCGEGPGDWGMTWVERRESHPCDQMLTSFILPGTGVYDLSPLIGAILVVRQVGKLKESN